MRITKEANIREEEATREEKEVEDRREVVVEVIKEAVGATMIVTLEVEVEETIEHMLISMIEMSIKKILTNSMRIFVVEAVAGAATSAVLIMEAEEMSQITKESKENSGGLSMRPGKRLKMQSQTMNLTSNLREKMKYRVTTKRQAAEDRLAKTPKQVKSLMTLAMKNSNGMRMQNTRRMMRPKMTAPTAEAPPLLALAIIQVETTKSQENTLPWAQQQTT